MTDRDQTLRRILREAAAQRPLSTRQRDQLQAALRGDVDAGITALLRGAAGPRSLPRNSRTALRARLADPRVKTRRPTIAARRVNGMVAAAAAVVVLVGIAAVVRTDPTAARLARPAPTQAIPTPSTTGVEPPLPLPGSGVVGGPVTSPPSPTTSRPPPAPAPSSAAPRPGAPAGGPVAAPGGATGGSATQRSVSRVEPDAGALTGGTPITIFGTGLSSAVRVEIGGRAASELRVHSGSRLTAKTPAGEQAGSASVVVVFDDGARYGLSPGYTYIAAPVLDSVSPDRGPSAGGNTVVLSGKHLRVDCVVRFGSTQAEVVEATSTSLRVVVPSHLPGLVDVTVTTDGGTSSGRRYTYLPA